MAISKNLCVVQVSDLDGSHATVACMHVWILHACRGDGEGIAISWPMKNILYNYHSCMCVTLEKRGRETFNHDCVNLHAKALKQHCLCVCWFCSDEAYTL